MGSYMIQDSDDDLDTLSPTKPLNSILADQSRSAESEDRANSLQNVDDEPRQISMSTPPFASLATNEPNATLSESAGPAFPLAQAGVKRKQTTMEMVESRKRARSHTGGASSRTKERQDFQGHPITRDDTVEAHTLGKASSSHKKVERDDLTPAESYTRPETTNPVRSPFPKDSGTPEYDTPASRSDKAQPTNHGDGCSLHETNAGNLRSNKVTAHPSSSDPGPDLPPKETYNPRPSRFRGAGTVDSLIEAIDFSKRPEKGLKGAKRGRPKSKGIATLEPLPVESNGADSVKDVDIDQDKFTSTNGVTNPIREQRVAETVEVEEPDVDSESIAQPPSPKAEPIAKRKRGRPKKQDKSSEAAPAEPKLEARGRKRGSANALAEQDDGTTTVYSDHDTRASKRSKRQPRQDEPRVLMSDSSDEDAGSTAEAAAAAAAAADDRPTRPPLSPSKSTNIERSRARSRSNVPGGSKAENVEPHVAMTGEESIAAPNKDPTTPRKEPPKIDRTPTGTGDTTKGKGPNKHSPLSGGKISYRVGLSRKARIEPLLRVMKK